jgi:hypothetical protein
MQLAYSYNFLNASHSTPLTQQFRKGRTAARVSKAVEQQVLDILQSHVTCSNHQNLRHCSLDSGVQLELRVVTVNDIFTCASLFVALDTLPQCLTRSVMTQRRPTSRPIKDLRRVWSAWHSCCMAGFVSVRQADM